MSDPKRFLTYRVELHPEGIPQSELQRRVDAGDTNLGACDAMLLCSIIYPEDGSYSLQLFPVDGRTGAELSDNEMFKVWAMLANRLAQSTTLSEGKKLFAAEAWADICALVFGVPQSQDTSEGIMLIPENGDPVRVVESLTFQEAQKFVGGSVQVIYLGSQDQVLLMNEEGKLKGMTPNGLATQLAHLSGAGLSPNDVIVGPAILVQGKAYIDAVLGRKEEA